MAGAALVTPDGSLRVDALPAPDAGVTTSVVAALGARGVGQSSLLNALFGASLAAAARPGKQITLGAGVALHAGDSSAAQVGPPRRLVVLDVEGFDGTDRAREEARDRAANLAVVLADIILFSVRMNDLPKAESNGVAALRAGLTEALKLQDAGTVAEPAGRRAFVVVVRDYDAEVLPREELINGFLLEMQAMYDAVSKPARSPARVSELFEFEFVTLPSAMLAAGAFSDAVQTLRERLTDPFGDEYLFDGGAYARSAEASLADQATAAWSALEEGEARDLPASKELMATFACDNAMRKVFDKYRRGVRDWDRETEEGNVIEDFGTAAASLMEETLDVYDQDAGPHRLSTAFQRKRDELRDKIDGHLYDLFTRQTHKLREVAYGIFKEELEAANSEEPGFEKSINKSLKVAQKYFSAQADRLRPKASAWRFDNETKELASHMREDATERLQQARLEEYAPDVRGRRGGRRGRRGGRSGAGSTRQPVSISFHYLDPAPFGFKDSRHEKLSTDDNLEYGRQRPAASGDGAAAAAGLPILPGKGEAWDRDYIYQDKPGKR
jgi:hypothetical protein